jgi:hypothetical protein
MLNEMIPDWLYSLIKESKPITQETYEKLQWKSYTSGQEIKIGDIMLFGLSLDIVSEGDIKIDLIKFNPEEIGTIYEIDDRKVLPKNSIKNIPYLKKITTNK